MKWYLNMKIGKKLISGFILVALISGAMGVYAIYNLKALDNSDTQLYENMTVPLSEIGMISTEFQRTRVNTRDMILAQTPEDIQASIDKIIAIRTGIDPLSTAFEATILTDEMRTAFEEYKSARIAFKAGLDKVIELAKQNKDAEAVAMMSANGESGKASQAYQDAIDKIVAMMIEDAKAKSDSNTAQADLTTTIMIAVIVVVTLLSIFIGVFISSLITRPLKKSVYMIEEMSKGHFGERLNLSSKDEIGQMARSMDFFADELQLKVIGVMKRISEGDVTMDIVVKDEKDEIAPTMKNMVETISGLNGEVQILIQAITEGKLDMRGKGDDYSGSWKELISGINGLIDAFVAPINMTAEYVERISKGDIPPRITDTYLGDFNEIKNNINGCIDVMNGLLGETNRLINAIQEGKLDNRGDAAAYTGEWGTLLGGINNLIDAFVAPINMTAEYVERISKGDIPPRITDTYLGDFNEIKNNINGCIDAMNGLLNETNKLIKAAQDGQLDTRGNAAAFSGEWGSLVGGINNLIDAFAAPINLTSEYVDRISKGDIPAKITDSYNGDFNIIIDNLNNCIDIMSGLHNETDKLIKAAQGGQLDTRANKAGFNGSWEELVSG
ncbi:MAG TPA: MCP four helix bundle domain-containing protein, partial [Anaerovoracaceae bacterium]|nr:MCP four helix bundle domain-containing protein [Anaerovoracaceae bacterium]